MHSVSKLDKWLKTRFAELGEFVGKHRNIFLVAPILVSLVLSSGMLQVEYSSDPDHLMTPVNGEGRAEKALAEKYFPTNFSDFDATRSTKFGLYGYVMVTGQDGRSILDPEAWTEVRIIQNKILEMKVEFEGEEYGYTDICAKWDGECYTNSLLSVADTFAILSKGAFREPVESYYGNYSKHLTLEMGRNLTLLSLQKSEEILEGVEKIELIANQTLHDLYSNFKMVSQAVEDFEVLSLNLYDMYKTQVKPSFEAINLPAYFGGITLRNQTLDTLDICQLVAFLPDSSTRSLCRNPMELMSSLSELVNQGAETDITRSLILRIRSQVETALNKLNIKGSADQIIHILKDISSSLKIFSNTVEETVGETENLDINKLVGAEAVLIGGLLDSDKYPGIGELWEMKFLETIDQLKLNRTRATALVSNSLKIQMLEGVERLKPILVTNIVAMVLFSMAVCFTKDIVTSKPWVGLAGVLSTVLATFSGFGLLVYLGAEFTNFNYGAIFIMIGIGLDDTFVVLNSWERTDRKADVPQRLRETMSEAGVSILITSLTDILSFYSAILAPYPYVKIFCLYSGTCILFLFLFQITFFLACLAWSGEHEAENRSGFTLLVQSSSENRYRELLCLRMAKYEVTKPQSEERKERRDRRNEASRVLKKVISARTTRITLLFIYIGYLCLSVYGIMNVAVYFDRAKLINFDSSLIEFVELEDRLFRDKSFSISVIVTGDLRYKDPETIQMIETLLTNLESSFYINKHLTKSWLRHFQTVSSAKEYLLNQTQMFDTEEEFVNAISKFYSTKKTPYALDIKFNKNRTRILASRFLIQGQYIHTTKDEEKMVVEIRDVCQKFSSENIQAKVYNSYFPYTDQYLTIFSQSIQCILTTGLIVVAVSVLLLPDYLAAFTAIICIVSTLTGTLGFMSLWGIVLDGITLINLVMCIGFSVDFSAHFSYHYIDLMKKEGTDDVVDQTLVSVVKPILQAGVSTVLGILGLLFAPSYGFVIFFKMVFIVISLGFFHSLILLPCLLQFLLDLKKSLKQEKAEPPKLIYARKLCYENEGFSQHI